MRSARPCEAPNVAHFLQRSTEAANRRATPAVAALGSAPAQARAEAAGG
jgi:hypothetical protein